MFLHFDQTSPTQPQSMCPIKSHRDNHNLYGRQEQESINSMDHSGFNQRL